MNARDRRLCPREIARKYAANIAMKHAQPWNYGADKVENSCHKTARVHVTYLK
jgi:hypothetical protein